VTVYITVQLFTVHNYVILTTI